MRIFERIQNSLMKRVSRRKELPLDSLDEQPKAKARPDTSNLLKLGFDRGKVVATTEAAEQMYPSFAVKPNKLYQFYVRTDIEGRDVEDHDDDFGHIILEEMTLHRLGFGVDSTECTFYQFEVDPSQNWKQHFWWQYASFA